MARDLLQDWIISSIDIKKFPQRIAIVNDPEK
jgi:hypothetical protein